MSTPFQSALSDYLSARETHLATVHAAEPDGYEVDAIDATAQSLAQAGDRLESEVRRMIREEVRSAVRFETYGADQ